MDKQLKIKVDLCEINFEGKIVKPKGGYYRCPYNCHNPAYPKPKWKTEKGFQKHMLECASKPSRLKEIKESNEKHILEFNKICDKILSTLEYKVGQMIYYVKEICIKPTHDNNGRRLRYDAEYRYEATKTGIVTISFKYFNYCNLSEEYILNNCLLFNNEIRIIDLVKSFNEAEYVANEKQIKHKEHLDFSSRCR